MQILGYKHVKVTYVWQLAGLCMCSPLRRLSTFACHTTTRIKAGLCGSTAC